MKKAKILILLIVLIAILIFGPQSADASPLFGRDILSSDWVGLTTGILSGASLFLSVFLLRTFFRQKSITKIESQNKK